MRKLKHSFQTKAGYMHFPGGAGGQLPPVAQAGHRPDDRARRGAGEFLGAGHAAAEWRLERHTRLINVS